MKEKPIAFHGACPNCGFKREVKQDPATMAFAKRALRLTSQMTGIKQSSILGKYGTEEERDARRGLARYLFSRGWSWSKIATVFGRSQAAGVWSMQNTWYSSGAERIFRELTTCLGGPS